MRNLYVGIDESNHGRPQEIFVAVFSDNPEDIKNETDEICFPKRSRHKDINSRIGQRDYRFLLAPFSNEKYLISNVAVSLLSGVNLDRYNHLNFYIDGELTFSKKTRIKEAVSKYLKFDVPQITVLSGPDFDRKYKLVSCADELAHFLFRKRTLEQLVADPKNVVLNDFLSVSRTIY